MSLARLARKTALTLQTKSQLSALSSHEDGAARAIAQAIERAGSDAVREATSSVERERAAMLASSRPLTVETSLRWNEEAASETVEETVAHVCRASVKPSVGRLLYALVRQFEPASCVELGSCLGLSAAYQATALRDIGDGRLVTLEGQPAFAARADETLSTLALDRAEVVRGRFQDTLGGVLDRAAPVGYAYIDGHHDEQATREYFERFLPVLTDDAVLVFDDINWSDGMRRAWRSIAEHPQVAVAVSLYTIGVVVTRLGHAGGPDVAADLMYW